MIMKRKRFAVFVPSSFNGRVVCIYFTLITSKPRFTNLCEVSFAELDTGNTFSQTFVAILNLEWKVIL
jgi:hypothetical protein